MRIISNSAGHTLQLGARIGRSLNKGDIVCLIGDLGSGKTVFAKGIARGLGIDNADVVSPTFILMRQYDGRLAMYHFDLYRLEDVSQISDLGYEEYFFGGGVAVVEWADKLGGLSPKACLRVELKVSGKQKREIRITAKGAQYKKALESINEDTGD
ncbi:MAG: tRNA (adenosine(37)-N6)-threonylcarbamoyltransferase complex ATPase subunit type 1 TsaE [Candidatus Omnitrophica bacterium]|nr:tRNA (adenosine(37)-N6)-threonylcarbamoyltransferase complex ATPase subunit type 1 TsaE [Candidatus Omnitrophota bacterium]